MGIGWLAAADQARLAGDKPQMFLIADAPRLWECERAFVDTVDRISGVRCDRVRRRNVLPGSIPIRARPSCIGSRGILIVLLQRRHFGMEGRLHARGVGCGQAVLRRLGGRVVGKVLWRGQEPSLPIRFVTNHAIG